MGKLTKIGAALASFGFAIFATAPVFAVAADGARTVDGGTPVSTNFTAADGARAVDDDAIKPSFESSESDDGANFRFGSNVILAGNKVNAKDTVSGLLFTFGRELTLGTISEYSIVAGETINYSAATDKDLFIAGNKINITNDAKIGRDIYATGNEVIVEADLYGDLSVASNSVIIRDATISGNVNLSVGSLSLEGKVTINGKLTYNDDAKVTGLDTATIAATGTYQSNQYTKNAGELWLSQLFTVLGLFVAMILVLVLFPQFKDRVRAQASASKFGKNILFGLGFVIAVPLIGTLLCLTVFGLPSAFIAFGVLFIVCYLAQGFTGFWLGHIILSKLFRANAPALIETLAGLIILGCFEMIPYVGFGISTLAGLTGTGLALSCVFGCKRNCANDEETAEPNKALVNPFREKKAAAKKSPEKKSVKAKTSTKKK